ncbi:MAG: aminotransferase class I/II-fold pyridoxal phosphate-dependent enzyme [Clostridia bacterium]|nr:aminotransferase class I/II-fold pyridoxal phosphate-dependent enzyme [Clostridia bacterium]
MNTPICDFINQYVKKDALRLHMPGHKGKEQLGFEKYDITEIVGADSLYHANGIIMESEKNATALFESGGTFYSTEGSSHVIRAMLYLAKVYSGQNNGYVLAGRNAHSSFISACVLNDLDVEWIYPNKESSYLSCIITEEKLENALSCVDKMPICVYVTSPDYLGNMCDIEGLAQVCKKHGTMLVVDNAHGSYLKFSIKDMHPISLGATMCCDSAHKTLPVLTGGAYLHIGKNAPEFFRQNAKQALSLFGSTSPSYLTLASLDNANKYIANGYKEKLQKFEASLNNALSDFLYYSSEMELLHSFFSLREPLKLVFDVKKFGYWGGDFAKILEEHGVICEFFDDDYLVLMPSLENGIDEIRKLFRILSSIETKAPLSCEKITVAHPKKKMSIRQAAYLPREQISVESALGRTLATSSISCPPAVSLIVCGEVFDEGTIALSKKYGINHVFVVKDE